MDVSQSIRRESIHLVFSRSCHSERGGRRRCSRHDGRGTCEVAWAVTGDRHNGRGECGMVRDQPGQDMVAGERVRWSEVKGLV